MEEVAEAVAAGISAEEIARTQAALANPRFNLLPALNRPGHVTGFQYTREMIQTMKRVNALNLEPSTK